MHNKMSLKSELLRFICNPKQFSFKTTADITTTIDNLGQTRALEALKFGVEMKQRSYHMYALGPEGLGKKYFVRQYLDQIAVNKSPPADWCYVYNFKEPQKPLALKFAPNQGIEFKNDMKIFIEQSIYSLAGMFESKEYQKAISKIEDKYKEREEKKLIKLQNIAAKKSMTVFGIHGDYEIAPLINDKVMTKEQIAALPEAERVDLSKKINKLQARLEKTKLEIQKLYTSKYQKLKTLEHNSCQTLIDSLMQNLTDKYRDSKVLNYLSQVKNNIIDAPIYFLELKDSILQSNYTKYEVNVIINNHHQLHAPIIYEPNPTYLNLIGQLEGSLQQGVVNNDFTLIKAGSLHKANGGFLIIEVNNLLKEKHAWESLKRILLAEKISIEPVHSQGAVSASQLQPEPIPLDIKVIILGDRHTYESLGSHDENFNKVFKVLVDFETTIHRTKETLQEFILYVASIIQRKKLMPFDRKAMARVIEYCIRLTGDSHKITLHSQSIIEILEESIYCAQLNKNTVVQAYDIEEAILNKIKRRNKIREKYYESILDGSTLIDIKGKAKGQINGVSIIEVPELTFGFPTKITATTCAGKDEVVDIQRETNLGGDLHSRGVLILSGFLKGRYAKNTAFSLSASLVLEQTYGFVDGDSATLGELCALISSLGDIAVNQSLAVTGSLNQHGLVQPVGGINEKVEGFFDICLALNLTGKQGVIIPEANVKNLMLKHAVVDACKKKAFHIYPVTTFDEAMLLLTGKKENEVNNACEKALQQYALARRRIME